MITLNDFKFASFDKKCNVVTSDSDYLTMRRLGDCKIYLYHTGDFFIEVFYSSEEKKVLMIRAFNDADSILPYVEKVSLEDLF